MLVTLDVPNPYAAKVTMDDLVDMARAGCPDSSVNPGPPDGTQVTVDADCQEEDGEPVFADVFVEHDITSDPEVEFADSGFKLADPDADTDDQD